MLLHILHTSLSARPISRHAHRPSPLHQPHRTVAGRKGTYAMTSKATSSTWRDTRAIPTRLRPHWTSAMTAQSATAIATIPTEISPVIRSAALKSDIICLTWQRKSSAMTRRIQLRRAPCSARRSIMLTVRGRECGVRMTVLGLPDM